MMLYYINCCCHRYNIRNRIMSTKIFSICFLHIIYVARARVCAGTHKKTQSLQTARIYMRSIRTTNGYACCVTKVMVRRPPPSTAPPPQKLWQRKCVYLGKHNNVPYGAGGCGEWIRCDDGACIYLKPTQRTAQHKKARSAGGMTAVK